MTGRRAAGLAALACATLAACTSVPPAPAPAREAPRALPAPVVPDDASPRDVALARHERLARAAREAGDLTAALDHYRVLLLLDAGNPAHREALRATQAARDAAVQEQLRTATAARRAGENAKAREAWLRVLVLDADNGEAEKGLRELEQAAMARTQADRAARARSMDEVVANVRSRVAVENAADLDQRLELVRASDPAIAVREARAWAEANPGDKAGRQRLGAALAERGRELDAKGQREWALALYEQAVALGGSGQGDAGKRAAALRKALAEDAYAQGMRARGSDLAAAIRHFEAALRYDAQHARAKERLAEARAAQKKLERIAK